MKFSLLFITVIFFFAACNNQTDKELFNGEIAGIEADCDGKKLKTSYIENGQDYMPVNIPYIKLTKQFNSNKSKDSGIELSDEDSLDSVPVRSVAEIALEKEDISWLKQKKYYN